MLFVILGVRLVMGFVVCKGQIGCLIKVLLAFAAESPKNDSDKGDEDQYRSQASESPDIHDGSPYGR